MKRFVFFSLLSCVSFVYGGDTPVRDLKLTSDANANGYSLTNLPAAFILQIGGDTKESIDARFSGLYQGTNLIMSFVDSILCKTNLWNAAYSWGDWHSAVAQKLDSSATNGWETGSHSSFLTSAPPQSVVSVNGQTGAVEITAEQIGALTNETDEAALAALAAYAAYWPPNATASSWFTFTTNSGAITITGYGGGGDVVIPDYINGLPVTTIGENAFEESGVTSIGGAGNVVTVGNSAFAGCFLLASVSLPQVLAVGDYAFANCFSLASVYFDNDAPTIGPGIFAGLNPNQVTNYVTNPQATGWGATFGGMPVVRLPLYADAIYQAGELVATTGHVAQAIASQLPGIVYSNSVSALTIYTNASGAATSWWSVARGVTNSGTFTSGTPGAITNGQSVVAFGVSTNRSIIVTGSAADDYSTSLIQAVDYWGNPLFRVNGIGQMSVWGNRLSLFSAAMWCGLRDAPVVTDYGQRGIGLPSSGGVAVYIDSATTASFLPGGLTVVGTNTAAEVRSLGGYSIFDSGSNCYWRVTASNGTFYASDTNGVRKFKFATETP